MSAARSDNSVRGIRVWNFELLFHLPKQALGCLEQMKLCLTVSA